MKDNKIKKKLHFDVPQYDVEAFEKTLIMAKNMDFGIETHRMTEVQSILAQIKFFSLKAWLLKIVIACFLNIGIQFEIRSGEGNFWDIMSIFIPLLCLGSTNEISNILQPNLKGLLMTVRYSIRKVILIKLILFGSIDFLVLILSITSTFLMGVDLRWTDLLYVVALYNLMCGGCIYILNHTKETNAIFACSVWGGSLTVMNLIIKNTFSDTIASRADIVLLFIILLSIWKTTSEIKNMLGGLREGEISSQQFV